ncbi:PREDICTED: galactosylceramide sulfotransferase-like, partial [Branchiostoma belcheri]|uniref:Galactosylceramide sulfotransferase-like n=1 Tax=Branchiostoma belcheri TaxID=7741 RepID=A0A6P4YL18_BRABE
MVMYSRSILNKAGQCRKRQCGKRQCGKICQISIHKIVVDLTPVSAEVNNTVWLWDSSQERARRYVNELEADFTLVMLMDYVDESYVLLKRLMCWELQDVLYITKNNRSYSFKDYVPSEKETAMLRRWKAVDYLLHDTFNKSLWRKIAAQGPDFFEEVQHFKEVNSRVNMYCAKLKKGGSNLTVEASRWNSQFEVDAEFCRVLKSV